MELSKRDKKRWKRECWLHQGRYRNDKLLRRAELKIDLEQCIENGKIAIFESGMDCDCSEYERIYHQKAMSVMEYIKYQDETFKWADGTVSVGYGKPSQHPIESYSRDLAAEAYENGHAHVVYV